MEMYGYIVRMVSMHILNRVGNTRPYHTIIMPDLCDGKSSLSNILSHQYDTASMPMTKRNLIYFLHDKNVVYQFNTNKIGTK